MKKIVSIVGARPNFIKLAALSPILEKNFRHIVIHTGQHYDLSLSQNIFNELFIKSPKYNLGVGSGTHGQQTAKIITLCEKTLLVERPDMVIVYGDTNSALGGAIAASKLNIPIVHVEAGERCGNKQVPEELNRIVVDHISSLQFAPSKKSLQNLRNEGIANSFFTGDLMVESATKANISPKVLKKLKLKKNNYLYVTIHRSENTVQIEPLLEILSAIQNLGRTVLFTLHPRTENILKNSKVNLNLFTNIKFSPLKYNESLSLIKNAKFVITDSGGIQKECFALKTPCITLRGEIEEKSLIKSGWTFVVNPKEKLESLRRIINNFQKPKIHPNIYGSASASNLMFEKIRSHL